MDDTRNHHFDLESVPASADRLRATDAVVIITAHDDFDYELIRENASLIVDSRGVHRQPFPNVIKA